jgi:hypothetical protein
MRHFITLLVFCIPVIFSQAKSFKAQGFYVETKLNSIELCPNADNSVPVLVKNMIGVDSFNLVLTFNPSVIRYQSYDSLNPSLTESNFSIIEGSGNITMSWHGNAASIISDRLVKLIFLGISGNTELKWDTLTPGNCIYHGSDSIFLETNFINGYASVASELKLTLRQVGDTICEGRCNAYFGANVTGGKPPYTYSWNGHPSLIGYTSDSLCVGSNTLIIKDNLGCELEQDFNVPSYPGAYVTLKIECEGDTTDVLYRENPVLTFSFEEISPTHVVEAPLWDFGDGHSEYSFNPTHVYENVDVWGDSSYILKVNIRDVHGCDSTYTKKIKIQVIDNVLINNVLVPCGAEKNRQLTIADKEDPEFTPLIHQYEHIEIVVFDRWGRKVYTNSNYQSDWKAEGLPDGVYFYVVKIVGKYTTKTHKGSLTIICSGKN